MDQFISSHDLQLILRIVLAAFFGWLIGLERETLGKTAGTRTFALVSLGAALFALADPTNLQPIAAGIGFLCAGLIIFREGRVEGLTTAAALWTAAGLGLVFGQGLYAIGITAAVLVLVITYLLRFIHPEEWKMKK